MDSLDITDSTTRVSIPTEEVASDSLPLGRAPEGNKNTENLKPFKSKYVHDLKSFNPTAKAGKADNTYNVADNFSANDDGLTFKTTSQMPRSENSATENDLVNIPGLTTMSVKQAIDLNIITKSDSGYSLVQDNGHSDQQSMVQSKPQPSIELNPNEPATLSNTMMQEQTEAMREHLGDDKFERYAELIATHDDIDDVIDALGDELGGQYEYAEKLTEAYAGIVVKDGLEYAESRGADTHGFIKYLQDHPNQNAVKRAIASVFKTHNPAHLNELINSYVHR